MPSIRISGADSLPSFSVPDFECGSVLAWLSSALYGGQTGHLACQRVGDVGCRRTQDLFGADAVDGAGYSLFSLDTEADHDHVFD